MSLDNWIEFDQEAESIVDSFKYLNPHLDVEYSLITTEFRDLFYIKIEVSESTNHKGIS